MRDDFAQAIKNNARSIVGNSELSTPRTRISGSKRARLAPVDAGRMIRSIRSSVRLGRWCPINALASPDGGLEQIVGPPGEGRSGFLRTVLSASLTCRVSLVASGAGVPSS